MKSYFFQGNLSTSYIYLSNPHSQELLSDLSFLFPIKLFKLNFYHKRSQHLEICIVVIKTLKSKRLKTTPFPSFPSPVFSSHSFSFKFYFLFAHEINRLQADGMKERQPKFLHCRRSEQQTSKLPSSSNHPPLTISSQDYPYPFFQP